MAVGTVLGILEISTVVAVIAIGAFVEQFGFVDFVAVHTVVAAGSAFGIEAAFGVVRIEN